MAKEDMFKFDIFTELEHFYGTRANAASWLMYWPFGSSGLALPVVPLALFLKSSRLRPTLPVPLWIFQTRCQTTLF